MSADRKAKMRKREESDRRQRAKWVATYERILPLVGAKDLFLGLPETTREWIRRARFPSPEIVVGDDFKQADEQEAVRSAVSRALDDFVFTTSDGHEISAQDCFRVVISLREAINHLQVEPPDGSLSLLVEQTQKKLEAVFEELIDKQLMRLLVEIDKALAEFTRIDTAIYSYEFKYERVGQGKGLVRITLHKSPPDRIRILRNGETRPAFRCATSVGIGGIQWVDLPASLIGINDHKEYPLYVQSHTIRHLHERIPFDNAGFVHDAMWQSFSSPKVIQNDKGEHLVEYRFFDFKLGYFVIELIDERFLATTFLFLTMQGTPEAGALYQQLRLSRPDIQRLELDSLRTYVLTDLQKDQELVRIFDMCGRGHLLKMVRPETEAEWVSGYARDLRKYLRMKLT